jgi:hypothetical protein
MSDRTQSNHERRRLAVAAAAGGLVALLAAAAAADDRDLLREATGNPYVFVLLDTSGSMNWAPKCTQESLDAGDCDVLCPTGDCFVPRNADDPASKFYQAKEVLYDVLGGIDGVNLGFATFNQDRLRIADKHWLYRASAVDPGGGLYPLLELDSGTTFPAVGDEEVFGDGWTCDEGSGFREAGCWGSSSRIADMDDPEELRRAHRLPKLGRDMDETTTIYLRDNADGKRYKLVYKPLALLPSGAANGYGNPFLAVDVEARRCTDNAASCSSTQVDEKTIFFALVGDFIAWDFGPEPTPPANGFFTVSDSAATDTCDGWDGNDDTGADKYPNSSGYDLRWPTAGGDARGSWFDLGDVIPLDWNATHKQEILERLAPGGSFGVASRLRDERQESDSFLRLADEAERPIIANGATPLGNSIKSFRTWYSGCPHGNCPRGSGWEDVAATMDPDWACRKKYLLVISDGDETCSGPDACSGTAGLRAQAGVKTYVVAFGVENSSGNRLNCMAANGGTGDPIYPQNKEELRSALIDIFAEIRVEARSFASASVPTVQNETSDKIYLSSFTPLKDVSVWPGRIDAYRKPLPLDDDDTPYLPPSDGTSCTRCCGIGDVEAAGWMWNAGDELLAQAPTPAEADLGYYKVGAGPDERRILYGQDPDPNDFEPDVPAPMRLFVPADPTDAAERYDLWRGLGLIPETTLDGTLAAADEDAAEDAAARIIGNAVKIKTEVVEDPAGIDEPQVFEYVLGDVFHADPEILDSPDHLIYYHQDLHGYQEFADQHFWRRKMLVVAANDGQLHFFDAGIRKLVYDPSLRRDVPKFTDGTGTELFSYMPRLVMPVVGDQFAGSPVADPKVAGSHVFSLDGNLTVADVHVDPLHHGDDVDPDHRGWRTVLVAGLREGGDVMFGGGTAGFASGYYALDVTQPDELRTPPPTPLEPDPDTIPVPEGSLLPSCLRVGAGGGHLASADCPAPAGAAYPFPAALWSFTDRVGNPGDSDRERFALDEDDGAFPPPAGTVPTPDGNGFGDLGDTWSKPVVGRIRLCAGAECNPAVEPNDLDSRFVAIFGGGLDSQSPSAGRTGNWLYMVDVETGAAIYKRQLRGSAAAGPAVLDRDQDGLLDVVYIPTTHGLLYKVDLTARTPAGDVPKLAQVEIGNQYVLGSPLPAGFDHDAERVVDPVWDPFPIFDAGGRQIFMTPTAVYVPRLDQYALAFGTGNRNNLWEQNGIEGRFYTLVDEDYERLDETLPRTEDDYELIAYDAAAHGGDLLLEPTAPKRRGWVLGLEADDRVITQAFALVSVLVFTTFQPFETVADPDAVCARTGESRIFVIDATNADAFTDLDELSEATVERFFSVGDFTTSPFVDQSATKNPFAAAGRDSESLLDPVQEDLQDAIREMLKRFFPDSCRYNDAYSLTVSASRSDTGMVRYATIPIALCPVDWKQR